MNILRYFYFLISISVLCNLNAAERPGWRLGAGVSPYHFALEQDGDFGKKSYSSSVVSSYRFLVQKQNEGWIWNNELNLSFLNFTNGKKETIPLYDFHTGLQWRGWLGGIETSKNLMLDSRTETIRPKDVRSHWLAFGYRYTPKNEHWRLFSKLSLLLDSSFSGESVVTLSGHRLILGFEQIGIFRGFFLDKFSWSILPYVDLKAWDIKLKDGRSADLRFIEYGLVLGINRLF